jgi:phosphopentomutase
MNTIFYQEYEKNVSLSVNKGVIYLKNGKEIIKIGKIADLFDAVKILEAIDKRLQKNSNNISINVSSRLMNIVKGSEEKNVRFSLALEQIEKISE